MNSGILGFGIRNTAHKESGIPLAIGIQNPSSTQKDWNPAPGIRNPWRGIRNPRLSWIPFYVEMLFLICYQDTGFAEVITYRCLFYLFSVVDEEAKNSREHFLLKCKRMASYSPQRYTLRLDDSSGCGTVTSMWHTCKPEGTEITYRTTIRVITYYPYRGYYMAVRR